MKLKDYIKSILKSMEIGQAVTLEVNLYSDISVAD